MRLAIILAALAFIASAMAADAPEHLNGTQFAFNRITVFGDDGGQPGDSRKKVNVDSMDLTKVVLEKWDDDTEMMLINFGQGDVGWVKKSDLVPPANVCGKSQTRMASAAVGGNTNTKTLASRGLIEKACN